MILLVVDMFPQTDDFWICFRKQRKRSKSVDMFPNTDDINLIATRHVECVVLLSKSSCVQKSAVLFSCGNRFRYALNYLCT